MAVHQVISLNLLDAIFMPAGLTPNTDVILLFIILNPTTFAACMTAQAAVIVGLVHPTLSF